jgi:hypothetical protein
MVVLIIPIDTHLLIFKLLWLQLIYRDLSSGSSKLHFKAIED